MMIPFVVQAATITSSNFDRDTYKQGKTGYITVTVYNDKDDKIRVTELTATINYYYTDENVYLQKFFTNATLPVEIQQGDSGTFYIPFSLPTNIAPGYTNVDVKAETQLWNSEAERWYGSDHPTYQPKLYLESPYKQQLDQQLATNRNTTTMIYVLASTTILFAIATICLFILKRMPRVTAQPVPVSHASAQRRPKAKSKK
jgi:hypothetical protein